MAKLVVPKVTYGSDPEFFVSDSKTGKLIPAFGLFGGTKKNGVKLDSMSYLEDGAALEMNFPPRGSFTDLLHDIYAYKAHFEKKVMPGIGLLSFNPEIVLSPQSLENPLAKQIGCVEDLDAWNGGVPRKPFSAPDFKERRYAGCHFHIGIQPWPELVPKYIYVQFLDLVLGSQLHLIDDQKGRRQFYGLPGLYRETSYGVEYRSPSIALMGRVGEYTGTFSELLHAFNRIVQQAISPIKGERALAMLDDIYNRIVDWPHLKEALSRDYQTREDKLKIAKTLLEVGNLIGATHNYYREIL